MEGKPALAYRRRWAEEQFGTAELGDKRRTRRLVKLAEQMAGNSNGSIPQQTGTVADMKAAYRFLSEDEVTHEAVCQSHFQLTRKLAGEQKMVFFVQDTCELDYTTHIHCQGLGPIGCGGRMQGLHQQNVLAVDPIGYRPIGLMYQRHHHRQVRPEERKKKRSFQRQLPLEKRETYWWIQAIQAIGSPPPGVQWVHVGDRGEDFFGVYDEARRFETDWLIRIAQDRSVKTPTGAKRLFSYARGLPSIAKRCLTVGSKGNETAKEVELNISAGHVTLLPSRYEPRYRGRIPVECWVVRVWEANPPKGREALEWLLCTSLSCETPKNALFVAKGYSLRWMVEEFHKCEKTGCQVEMRRLEHADRLEPLIGLLSVLAVGLLQLKFVARDEPKRPANSFFDEQTVSVMARYLAKSPKKLTVGEFWKGIGRLGGHLGRANDGPIGWLRAWRGWQSFQLILLGASLGGETSKRCG